MPESYADVLISIEARKLFNLAVDQLLALTGSDDRACATAIVASIGACIMREYAAQVNRDVQR